MTSTAN